MIFECLREVVSNLDIHQLSLNQKRGAVFLSENSNAGIIPFHSTTTNLDRGHPGRIFRRKEFLNR